MSMNDQINGPGWVTWLLSPSALLVLGLFSLVGALLFTGHGNHLIDALFYLPFAACLLMHLFMHHGHHHHHSDKGGRHE
jgi:hypothetical protein